MIVKRVPDFIYSPKLADTFVFDKHGRVVYIWRDGENPSFIIYDILFNDYIEFFAADVSDQNSFNDFKNIRSFLPVDTERTLAIISVDEAAVDLVLIHFDLQLKTYTLTDRKLFKNCHHVELVRDGEQFGLYYVRGDIETLIEEDSQFVLSLFHLNSKQIQLDDVTKEFKYNALNRTCVPTDLYLHQSKLWFLRRQDLDISPAMHPPPPKRSRPPEERRISYFDLGEECPSEVWVGIIKQETIRNLHWVQNSLIFQHDGSNFILFDLATYTWSSISQTGLCFASVFNGEWAVFEKNKTENVCWTEHSQLSVDERFVLTCAKQGDLYRVPLRNPLKLIDIAWNCTLNAGLLSKSSNMKLPFSRLF